MDIVVSKSSIGIEATEEVKEVEPRVKGSAEPDEIVSERIWRKDIFGEGYNYSNGPKYHHSGNKSGTEMNNIKVG